MNKSVILSNTRSILPAVLGALASVLLVALVTWAATTINNNINTGGTLTVSGASSLQAASTTSFSVSNLITVSGAGTSTYTGGISAAALRAITGGITSDAGDFLLTGGKIVSTGAGTSTFSGGVSSAGFTTTNGLAVTSGVLDASSIKVLAGTFGVGTSSPYQEAGITGDIALGSSATTTISVESTAVKAGCIELRDSDGRWVSIYAGKGGVASGRFVAYATTSTTAVGLLVIQEGRCQ